MVSPQKRICGSAVLNPMRNKSELRALLADGQLEDAATNAVAYAEAAGDTDALNGCIALQDDLKRYKSAWTSGQIAFEEFARAQARVTAGLLARIGELPDEPTPRARQSRIGADTFRWLIFYLFLISKFIVLGWAAFMWQTEGFLNSEAFSLFNALLPGLVVNASLMFRSLFRYSTESAAPRRYVAARFRTLACVAFVAYVAAQIFLTIQKVNGNLSFELASLSFAAVETALAQFMSNILSTIFQESKPS